ncbi:MAG: hypothetical protein ABI852_07555 [Gemmatimonadaceae bacterium]
MITAHSRRLFLFGALLLASASVAPAAFAQKKSAAPKAADRNAVNISGNWLVTGTSATDTLKSTAVFKQEGAAVTGTFDIPLIGSGKLSGTVKGDSVAFVIPFVLQEKPVEVHVTGLLKDKNTIAGFIKLPTSTISYPFTAKRQL